MRFGMRNTGHLRFLAVLLVACGGSSAPPPAAPAPAPAAAPEAAAPTCADGAEAEGPIAWYHDQYADALACAKARGLPLVIDLWAPWCHTCLSMSQTVLRDPGLSSVADRFVWLAVDTDKEVNAPVVDKFPPQAWPTYFVVGPDDEGIEARFVGGASVKQFREMLATGERAYQDGKAGALAEGSPLRYLRDAHRAEAAGDYAKAGRLYGDALAAAPADWPRKPDVLVNRIDAMYRVGDYRGCMAFGAAKAEETGHAPSTADFSYYAMTCAQELKDPEAAKPVIEHLFAVVSGLVDDAKAPLSVDDRADALRILREMKEMLGDEAAARKLAMRQKAMIDAAMAKAPTPLHAMTFAWPASEVYVYLGKGAELVPVLEKMEADLPNQYDPPTRLAWVLLELGKPDEALAHAAKAYKLVYGPRKARIAGLVANIQHARGDRSAELEARADVVKIWQALPEGQKNPKALEAAKAALKTLEAAKPQ